MRSRACRRLEKELSQIKRDHSNFDVVVFEDDLEWRVFFKAPEDCIYSSEEFV